MKKQEFLKELSIRGGCAQVQAWNFMNHLVDLIKEELKGDGAESVVPGIGKFKMVDVPETKRRNPTTGQTFMKPAHKKLKFKIAKSLSE